MGGYLINRSAPASNGGWARRRAREVSLIAWESQMRNGIFDRHFVRIEK